MIFLCVQHIYLISRVYTLPLRSVTIMIFHSEIFRTIFPELPSFASSWRHHSKKKHRDSHNHIEMIKFVLKLQTPRSEANAEKLLPYYIDTMLRSVAQEHIGSGRVGAGGGHSIRQSGLVASVARKPNGANPTNNIAQNSTTYTVACLFSNGVNK